MNKVVNPTKVYLEFNCSNRHMVILNVDGRSVAYIDVTSDFKNPCFGRHLFYDLNRVVSIEADKIRILEYDDTVTIIKICGLQLVEVIKKVCGKIKDTEKFYKTIEIQTKSLERCFDAGYKPLPTFTQISNRIQNGGKTIKNFYKAISKDRRETLLRQLSYYIDGVNYAQGYYDGNEIYFDGRVEGGCGFNGSFILSDNDYSIHT